MSSYIKFNHTYATQELLDLFNNSDKTLSSSSVRNIANLGKDCYNSQNLSPFFTAFPFIPKNDNSCELSQYLKEGTPRTNSGNNGLLIFPVSGSLSLSIYSYVSDNKDSAGRPILEPENISDSELTQIEQTKTETVEISSPIAVDGLSTYSLEPTEPNTVVFIMKINKFQSWESVVESLTM
jgi:hypothetical protein